MGTDWNKHTLSGGGKKDKRLLFTQERNQCHEVPSHPDRAEQDKISKVRPRRSAQVGIVEGGARVNRHQRKTCKTVF